ncbi:hypothetical protein JL722_13795 [Aureococcus anophagefferens]|nr:hypothetical protein JL722_13795 [Aureococcus anophagefferens]
MRGMLLLAIARSCAPLARPLRRLKTGGAALRASRSTATTDDFVADPAGAARRRARLDAALRDVGLDPASLDDDARLRGSSALRTYRSFVLEILGARGGRAPQRGDDREPGRVQRAPFVDVRREPSTLDAVRALQGRGVAVYALETTRGSVPLYDADLPAPLALVFGNELVGVHPDVLAACDGVVSLPTFGVKNSLNVASCAAAAVYGVVRRWRSS